MRQALLSDTVTALFYYLNFVRRTLLYQTFWCGGDVETCGTPSNHNPTYKSIYFMQSNTSKRCANLSLPGARLIQSMTSNSTSNLLQYHTPFYVLVFQAVSFLPTYQHSLCTFLPPIRTTCPTQLMLLSPLPCWSL